MPDDRKERLSHEETMDAMDDYEDIQEKYARSLRPAPKKKPSAKKTGPKKAPKPAAKRPARKTVKKPAARKKKKARTRPRK